MAEITGSFETAMILAASRSLLADFGDPVLIGWLISGYLIVGAAIAAVAGRLGDILGRRQVMMILLAVGAIGSLISAVAPNYPILLTGRVIQGLTGAILPLCIGLVRENLPPNRVSMGIGLMISGASAGTALGLVLGGWIVDTSGWHGVFVASALFCTTSFILIWRLLPPSPRLAASRIDWLSGILFAPGILALLFYISNGAKTGWTAPFNLGALLVALALLVWWLHRSLTSDDPLIDVRLFRDRNISITNTITALTAMSTLQITLVFSIMLQAPKWTLVGLGATATVAGLAKLPSNILSLFAGPLSGWLTWRGGGRLAMITGGLLTIGGWCLALVMHDTIFQVIAALCVISFGTTMFFAVGPTILAYAAPPERTSETTGVMTVIRQAFLGIGAQIVAVLLATDQVASPETGERYPTPAAFDLAIWYIIGLCVAATLVAFALPKGMRRHGNDDD
jgi:MFS family permease